MHVQGMEWLKNLRGISTRQQIKPELFAYQRGKYERIVAFPIF